LVSEVVRRTPRDVVDELLVVDDGCTDRSPEIARQMGASVLSLGRLMGLGAALRAGYRYAAEKNYDVAVVMAGNNKDSPEEIPLLLDPIADGLADFVQGSRYLKPRADLGDMPTYRRLATRLHPLIFSIVTGRRVTESTNGFRAVSVKVLNDRRINLEQSWLDEYELEQYLYISTIRLGYRTTEVPVTKVYPPRSQGKQSKVRPITGWWSMLRPLVYLGLRIKK
jgi:dolichol-phosphate mannosyltransferase